MESLKRVVVLGAGVAGIKIVKELQGRLPSAWRLVLVDENDYHQYLYRIHEVCNVAFREEDIVVPLGKVIDLDETEFRRVKVESVDPGRSLVVTEEGAEEPSQHLPLATELELGTQGTTRQRAGLYQTPVLCQITVLDEVFPLSDTFPPARFSLGHRGGTKG